MHLEHAKRLKCGQQVNCPADRGVTAYIGIVESQRLDKARVYTNSAGVEYIWVEVKRPGSNNAVWPSNRLGSV